jgi:hypothetical protein
MGKPVWILLPHLSDWRWMQTIETTPWYPTARLFRQRALGDWSGVLNRVSYELNLWIYGQNLPANSPVHVSQTHGMKMA